MEIAIREIGSGDYDVFHALLDAYYRAGEDADTPQEAVDRFIRLLFDKATAGAIRGCFAVADGPVGFALWTLDAEGGDFSELPGYGTILEIGVGDAHKNRGIGARLVAHCEAAMRADGAEWAYVCAYGPAQAFWSGRGYAGTERAAANGLPIMVKRIGGG